MNFDLPRDGAIEITTVTGCSNNCIYCPQDVFINKYNEKFPNEDKILSLENFKKYLSKIPVQIPVAFSGLSEPSVNIHFTDMLLHTAEMGYKVRVNTTVTGLTFKNLDIIRNISFTAFVVHLPAENENFSKIPTSDYHLDKIRKIEDSQISNLQFRVVGKLHPEIKKWINYPVNEIRIYYRAGNLQKSVSENFNMKNPDYCVEKGKKKGKIRCSRVNGDKLNRNVLLPNGKVLLCCMDYGIKHIVGDLETLNYDSLYQSHEYKLVREGLDKDSDIICRYCECAMEVT